jgi:hypothetical protein
MVHTLGALLKIGPHYGQGGECTKSEEILHGYGTAKSALIANTNAIIIVS